MHWNILNTEVSYPASYFPSQGMAMMLNNDIELKNHFIGWQCRIRQHAIRKNEGRPSMGMRADVVVDGESIGLVTMMIVKSDATTIISEFRFMANKTQDPKQRYDNAIKFLSEYYYQRPAEFDEELTAVFALDSALAKKISDTDKCELVFEQGNQRFELTCNTRSLSVENQNYQSTYWHNYLFNPNMPGTVAILGFIPKWDQSRVKNH